MRKYYFRVDGGNAYSIATGHIMRCLKLADFISVKEEARIYFIMKDYNEGVNLVKRKYRTNLLNRDIDFNNEINSIKNIITKDSIFICDIRGVNNEYITKIKESCKKFVLFDDLRLKSIHPDILINPTPFCYEDYKQDNYHSTTLLLGEKYFFINPSLSQSAYARNFKKDRYNIMASFGGADPCNITGIFIKNIVPSLKGHHISIVLGSAYKKKSEIVKKYKDLESVKFYTDISPLDKLFLDNDIAFTCGGDTCIEACSSGIATFIISSIYYERQLGQLLHQKKMAYFVADIEDIKNNDFDNNCLETLKTNNGLLNNLSKAGMNLIDGRGQERVYQAILN